MYLDNHKAELVEAYKRRVRGQNILTAIAAAHVCFALIALVITGNLIMFILSFVFSLALVSAINWIRWLFVVGSIAGFTVALFELLPALRDGIPGNVMICLSALLLAYIATLAVLAFNKKVNEFIAHEQQLGYKNNHSYRSEEYQSEAKEYDKERTEKSAPLLPVKR